MAVLVLAHGQIIFGKGNKVMHADRKKIQCDSGPHTGQGKQKNNKGR